MPEQVPNLSEILFAYVMKGKWDRVIETYKAKADSHEAKITASSDTALHLAVSYGKSNIVCKLVESLGPKASEILKQKNKSGNTPLHTAATLGDSDMCHCMASIDDSLIAESNKENATPLFLAAQFGHKDAFLCLHFHYKGNPLETCRRKANGDTILHAALKGQFFDLAFEITRKYPELVDKVNENGFTPLHILAAKPNAFKSGSRHGLFDKIIYRCIKVNEIKEIKDDSAAYLKRFEVEGTKVSCNPDPNETFRTPFAEVFHVSPLKKIRFWKASCFKKNDEENVDPQMSNSNHGKDTGDEKEGNYVTFIQFFKFLMILVLLVPCLVLHKIKKIITKKKTHTWALQVMKELMNKTSLYKYNEERNLKDAEFDITFDPRLSGALQGVETKDNNGSSNKGEIVISEDVKSSEHVEKKVTHETKKTEMPILIAARMGVTEMVKSFLEKFPVSIQDLDANDKNVLLLAVENRQSHTFRFLIKRAPQLHENVFRQLDNQGNNALHLAAAYGKCRPWLIPGSALQMQWELKWYNFVKDSITQHSVDYYNRQGKTPTQIFRESHKELLKDGSEWLKKTSESCSIVAALIAAVAFATSATVPGGVKDTGIPVLGDVPAFAVFSSSSLVAFCFSLAAVVFFLAIVTSQSEEKDFASKLPWNLILGLTALFTSIAAILVSFCACHFFQLRDELKLSALPIYIVTSLPVSFALAQLPLYFDLLRAIFHKVPQRSEEEFTL